MADVAGLLHFLHLNDLHGALNAELADRVRAMRQPDSIGLDTGDAIKAGNLAIPLRQEPVWEHFAAIPIEVGTIGNRETHVLEPAFKAKLQGHPHKLLCANLRKRDGSRPLPGSVVLERNGWRIGFVGVSVAMVTERMATQAASAFLWDDPVATAVSVARGLRPSVDVLVALTHIGFSKDKLLAEAAPEIDIIFGGHSHTVLEQPLRWEDTWIAQGGSHARFVGIYTFDPRVKGLSGGLVQLKD